MVNDVNFHHLLPKRDLLVFNDQVQTFVKSMNDYQAEMNRSDQKIEVKKTTDQYSTVTLINFNDNDLMLYGWFFYRTIMNTAAILATPKFD
jgi:hypothetical protein